MIVGEGKSHKVTFTIVKAIPLRSASEQVREPRRRPRPALESHSEQKLCITLSKFANCWPKLQFYDVILTVMSPSTVKYIQLRNVTESKMGGGGGVRGGILEI